MNYVLSFAILTAVAWSSYLGDWHVVMGLMAVWGRILWSKAEEPAIAPFTPNDFDESRYPELQKSKQRRTMWG